MAFQDFDLITERRKSEKRQQLKKRILIGVVSTVVLAGLIGCAFFVVTSKGVFGGNTKEESSQTSKGNKQQHIAHSERIVKLVCTSADYKEKCEGPLNKAIEADPKLQHPKDLLKVYVKVVEDEVTKAFDKTNTFKFETEQEKGAFEDCKKLFGDAKDDLQTSIDQLTAIEFKKLSSKAPDLNSWLSAVISFQQTCIDGFPEGKTKTSLQKLFVDSKEFVSNSLAMVTQVSTFLSTVQTLARGRLLLSDNSPAASLDSEGIPEWIHAEERRVLKAADIRPTPNVTVAKDGGDFKTISEALAAIPATYTAVVEGEGFLGLAMGFRNTAGPDGHQAVAARIQADRTVFANCRFEGYQDTLYTQAHRQFYRSCIITGTIDFIFGDAAVVLQNCIMIVRKPMDNQGNMVTAQGRMDKQQATGTVLQKCQIKADDTLLAVKDKIKSYLGRPWKEFSRTIVMETEIGEFIHPDGWTPWEGNFALNTLYYAEYNNTGPGASTSARVKWPGYKVINKEEASKYTVANFLKGTWVQSSGVPSQQGLYN